MAALTIRVLPGPGSEAPRSLPETASIRLVARLPAGWRCVPVMTGEGFAVEVELPGPAPGPAPGPVPGPAPAVVIARAFAEAGLAGWRLDPCG
ncbi:hypothetical protein [Kitasatospora sp. NPDC004272]